MADEKGERPKGRAQPPGRVTKGPFVDHCEAGKHAWCQCARSARYPYCDGTHRDDDAGPKPLKVVLETARTVVWCACGKSGNAPFCDGTHGRL